MKKTLAMLLALCMVLSLGVTAFASGEPSGEASDDAVWDAYVEYLHDFLVNQELPVNTGGMTIEIIEDEFMPQIKAGDFENPPAALLFSGLLDSGVAMTYEEFAAQYTPAGEAMSVEEAFIEYIHEWLIAEDEINSNMDENIRENEFMPLVREMNFVDFPAEMIYSGMLESGVPMTFEEFAAQYVPAAAPAGGDTSVEAWHAYLKEYVDAVPAVDDEALQVFSALIDADDFTTPPADMMFNAQWWGFAAMTYDEFVAAGGVYEIPAFDPGLVPD